MHADSLKNKQWKKTKAQDYTLYTKLTVQFEATNLSNQTKLPHSVKLAQKYRRQRSPKLNNDFTENWGTTAALWNTA